MRFGITTDRRVQDSCILRWRGSEQAVAGLPPSSGAFGTDDLVGALDERGLETTTAGDDEHRATTSITTDASM